jgi:hypothetical protein
VPSMPFLTGSTFTLPQSLEQGTVLALAFTRGTSPLGAGDGTNDLRRQEHGRYSAICLDAPKPT